MDMAQSELHDLRVLVVEDESLVAMLVEDTLYDLDCTVVAVASNLSDALDKASSMDFDVAILDVNLNGSPAFPIAERLLRRKIPFIFSTGYGLAGVPEAFSRVPVLAKPFRQGDVGRALKAAIKSHAAARQREAAARPEGS
jgi:CheY-like chemotaxis protein